MATLTGSTQPISLGGDTPCDSRLGGPGAPAHAVGTLAVALAARSNGGADEAAAANVAEVREIEAQRRCRRPGSRGAKAAAKTRGDHRLQIPTWDLTATGRPRRREQRHDVALPIGGGHRPAAGDTRCRQGSRL